MAKARATHWPSDEDLDLFHEVLRDVIPLRPDPAPAAKPAAKSTAKKEPRGMVANGRKPATPSQNPTKSAFPAALADHVAGRTPGLDKRSALRLRRGKTEIDGRIDLHGMTQAEARSALTAFVTGGYRHGRRCLLVITGKGRRSRDHPDRPWTSDHAAEPGVIRRMVPHWLEQAPLAGCVLAYSPAQPRDGGGGALYVLLKRQRAP